jgi:hypothetical protein
MYALSLLVIPSCIKTYKLVPSESSQGEELKEKREISREYVRSVKVYREWETDAMFDVLWVSNEVSEAYVDRYCMRRGKSDADKESMIAQELEKNKKEIKFYVLADVRDKFHPSLSDDNPTWTIYLQTKNNHKIVPTSIKEVELDSEIIEFFGYRYRKPKFKTPYEVIFPATHITNKTPTSITEKKPFKMIISSTWRRWRL